MAEEDQARVYGMPDPANRDPQAAEGLRGEKTEADRRRKDDLDFSHTVALDDGRTVTVSEGSGVAYAEETGRAGFAQAKPWRDTKVRDEDRPSMPMPVLPILGIALAAGIIAFALWRLRAQGADVEAEIDFRPAPELDL